MESNARVLKALGAWLFLVLLGMAAAVVTIALVNKYLYGPETDVRAYFQELRNGDGGQALGLLNARVPDANAAMLDGDPLEASAEEIEDVEVSTVSNDGERAVVRADYSVGGTRHGSEFSLHPVDTQWGFFTVWAFDETPLPTLTVALPGVTSVDINGMSVALPDSSGEFSAFFPGTYTASYTSEFLEAEPVSTVLTGPGQEAEIVLEPRPTTALEEEVDRRLKEHLDGCAEQSTLFPSGCPFSYEFDGRVQGDVEWTIESYPDPRIEAGAEGGWSLEPARGTARIAFDSLDLFTGDVERLERTVPFELAAELAVDGSTVRVTPRG